MNKFASTGGALALCLMSAACATHETTRLEARGALAHPVDTRRAEAAAASSTYWGDKWTAANLYERANATDSDVVDRFNLAATYQSTGRFAEAASLYRSVQASGRNLRVVGVTTNAQRAQRMRRFSLVEESTLRLARLDRVLARGSATPRFASNEIRSAESAGVQASAVVGGPAPGRAFDANSAGVQTSVVAGGPARGRVSDATAIQRDQAAQPLN